jgi:hypothetical protein
MCQFLYQRCDDYQAKGPRPQYVFAVDTFVLTDAPLDPQYLAHANLGDGAVLRTLDSNTVVPHSQQLPLQFFGQGLSESVVGQHDCATNNDDPAHPMKPSQTFVRNNRRKCDGYDHG